MFNLEQSIREWRQQMFAAGINTPAPLEELESHLREEIERQVRSGASAQEAFQRTVLQIGDARQLQTEFAKERNLMSFLGRDKFQAINRIAGTLWLATCCFGFIMISGDFISRVTAAHGRLGAPDLRVGLPLIAIYGAGILGSVLAIRGTKLGRRIVGIIASLFTLISLLLLFDVFPTVHHGHIVRVSIFTAYYAITAWLMLLPSHSIFKPATK